MGEIQPEKCEGRELTKDQLASAESSLGTIVDSATGPGSVGGKSGLAASGIDWTGARATLNIVRAWIL